MPLAPSEFSVATTGRPPATTVEGVDEPYFQLRSGSAGAGTYRSDPATGGPWSPELQHGGPPCALLVHVAESVAAAETGRDDLAATRLAAEFVGPVPVTEVQTSARVVRAARSAVLVEATLSAGERTCLQARVWLVRDTDTRSVARKVADPTSSNVPPSGLPGLGARFPYADSIEWRAVFGGLAAPGPGRIWALPRRPVVDAAALSSLQRAVLIGDSASGISAELDWATWSFLNVDLDVHLARAIIGEWVLLDARTNLGPTGSALTTSTISDCAGEVGATAQTLVVQPRRVDPSGGS